MFLFWAVVLGSLHIAGSTLANIFGSLIYLLFGWTGLLPDLWIS